MDIKPFNSAIELTNNGNLSLFFIGTGSAFSKINYQTNMLIIKGSDHILIDCGSLCPFALQVQYNTNISKINNIMVTHPHADHVGGLEEYALVNYYIKKSKGNILISDYFKKKLWNETLRGGIQYSEQGKMTFEDYFNQIKPKLLSKKPFEIYEANVGSINLQIFRTRHVTTKPDSLKNSQLSYGIVIDNRILFTGDTQFNKNQLEWLLNNYKLEAIFHDCDCSGFSEGVHASYKQLKTLDDSIRAMTYLCHYNSVAEKYSPIDDGFAGFAKPGVYYNF